MHPSHLPYRIAATRWGILATRCGISQSIHCISNPWYEFIDVINCFKSKNGRLQKHNNFKVNISPIITYLDMLLAGTSKQPNVNCTQFGSRFSRFVRSWLHRQFIGFLLLRFWTDQALSRGISPLGLCMISPWPHPTMHHNLNYGTGLFVNVLYRFQQVG